MSISIEQIKFISLGIFVTLKYSIISVIIGFIISLILTFFALSKYKLLNFFNKTYISLFRGTPLIIQLSIIYFGLPSLLGIKLTAFVSGILAFSLNSGAYISEIIRSAIITIDNGQTEAARSLGIPYIKTMKDIVIPQALRNVAPSLLNELIDMIKESSLVSIIGEADLMRRANLVAAEKYTYFTPLLIAAANYYILVMLLSLIVGRLNKYD